MFPFKGVSTIPQWRMTVMKSRDFIRRRRFLLHNHRQTSRGAVIAGGLVCGSLVVDQGKDKLAKRRTNISYDTFHREEKDKEPAKT
jgi:hypothetical protein